MKWILAHKVLAGLLAAAIIGVGAAAAVFIPMALANNEAETTAAETTTAELITEEETTEASTATPTTTTASTSMATTTNKPITTATTTTTKPLTSVQPASLKITGVNTNPNLIERFTEKPEAVFEWNKNGYWEYKGSSIAAAQWTVPTGYEYQTSLDWSRPEVKPHAETGTFGFAYIDPGDRIYAQ